jgi:hypothetical protein
MRASSFFSAFHPAFLPIDSTLTREGAARIFVGAIPEVLIGLSYNPRSALSLLYNLPAGT